MSSPKKLASSRDATHAELKALSQSEDLAVRRAVAGNERTLPEILEKLSHDSDKAVRRAVATNPNSPAKALMRLGAQFPKELLENPALDTLVLENPNLFAEVPEATLAAIAKREGCPTEVLGYLARAGHGLGLLGSLLQNAKTPRDAVQYLYEASTSRLAEQFQTPENSIGRVKGFAKHHVALRGEVSADEARTAVWRAVTERLADFDSKELGGLVVAAELPQGVKDEIIAQEVLIRGVGNVVAAAPAALLEAVAVNCDKRTFKVIQSAPKCPPWLAAVADPASVRQALQANQPDAEQHWIEATSSGSQTMRLALADHPLSVERIDAAKLLDQMVRACCDQAWRTLDDEVAGVVIELLIEHRSILPDTLQFVYEQINATGRVALPPQLEVLKGNELSRQLLQWCNDPVRTPAELWAVSGAWAGAKTVCGRPCHEWHQVDLITATTHTLKWRLARNPRTPVPILEALAADAQTAFDVACNPGASPQLLRAIFQSGRRDECRELARNPSTPQDVLLAIAMAPPRRDVNGALDWDSMTDLVRHPACPEEALLAAVHCRGWWKQLRSEDHWTGEKGGFGETPQAILRHPNVSSRVLDALISNKYLDLDSHGVRLAAEAGLPIRALEALAGYRGAKRLDICVQVTKNSSAPEDLLRKLAEDTDEKVRDAAMRALKKRAKGGAK